MTRQYINRTKQTAHIIPKITSSRSSQVNRSILQRVIENPTEENLTPSVVQQLQATHGNQVVNRLIQQAKQNSMQSNQSTPTINQTTQDTRTVQRGYLNYKRSDKSEKEMREKNFKRKQKGVPLVKAFNEVYSFLNSQNTSNYYIDQWLKKNQKSTGFFSKRKRKRFLGYKWVDNVLKAGNKSDISELMNAAIKGDCYKAVLFQQAALEFKQNPSSDSFHDIIEKFIDQDSESYVNISGGDRYGLLERADRMLENELDDDGNPQVDSLFSGDHMTENRLLTHRNNN